MITIEPPSTTAPPKPGLTRFLNRARAAIGLQGEVDVLLTTDAQLKSLNRAYRGKNKPTDILSFPTLPEIATRHAGDLAISLDTAARQAAAFNHSLETEIKVLLLHGLLHLAGEDHETDRGKMAARESHLRTQLKLPTSLIHRALTIPEDASSQPKPAHLRLPKKDVSSRPNPERATRVEGGVERPVSLPMPHTGPSRAPSKEQRAARA